jgi:Holliday junction resolvase RusA-like endonuclease
MIAKISIGWSSALLKNQSYVNNDMKLGHTDACQKAMWDIKMLLTPVAYSFNADSRIRVKITAYRPRKNIDAQNLVDAVSDAVELGIHIDDSNYDVEPVAIDDYEGKARIEIELTQ